MIFYDFNDLLYIILYMIKNILYLQKKKRNNNIYIKNFYNKIKHIYFKTVLMFYYVLFPLPKPNTE